MTDQPRLTVALTFDHASISDGVRRGDPPVKMAHAEFGVRVGAPRILDLLASRGIVSTWFVPGHTLETFPDSTAAIFDGGHEIGCHGWFHEGATEKSMLSTAVNAPKRFVSPRARIRAASVGSG